MSKAVLYIHGFNSSPQSMKAELTRDYLAKHCPEVEFHCPQIMNSPNAAIAQLEEIINSKTDVNWHFIGSSLGGYFSTYLAQKYQCKAVLVNPAITPYLLLSDYIGWQTNPYTQERYEVKSAHMAELKQLEQQKITENLYQVMVQTGDEVLDYQLAVNKFSNSQLIVQQGGDHSFINFADMLPAITDFLDLVNA
ncbi:YqiA/YcfP family alpha/beta fold hydrolase [Thalassotalea euphylliae]|uniref:Esterase YqiA n=1 Tax=Thalassotalea euphylliae TaxID=1655234 RepID=A0A3E0UHX1_9GAMM|nr:YqiA/YcfP family alpha/beta fold hydrolase [Thalassotalea euphylliae]REL36466.1 esterase YqiA [Thalassotalea euphylliae]